MLVLAMQFSKNLFESPDTEASPESGFLLSQNEREDDKFLVLFRNSSRWGFKNN